MTYEWTMLEEEKIFEVKPWFSIVKQKVQLPKGQIIDDFYQIHEPDYAEVVAVNAQKKVLGLWQYQHGVGKYNLGLPAGYSEPNDLPLETAKRELLEECQLSSQEWYALGSFVLEGNRKISTAHLYLAQDCQLSDINLYSDDLEEMKPEWLSINDWLSHIDSGKVATIGTVTAILLAKQKLINNKDV